MDPLKPRLTFDVESPRLPRAEAAQAMLQLAWALLEWALSKGGHQPPERPPFESMPVERAEASIRQVLRMAASALGLTDLRGVVHVRMEEGRPVVEFEGARLPFSEGA